MTRFDTVAVASSGWRYRVRLALVWTGLGAGLLFALNALAADPIPTPL